MLTFLSRLFSWWNGATLNTLFFTRMKGTRVGEDQFGNVYYEGTKDSEGRTRRWVIYNGYAEASAIPPGWHGWMHHRTDTPPTKENYVRREWETEHKANQTGTPGAYRPAGSILTAASRPKVTGDYDAWTPGS